MYSLPPGATVPLGLSLGTTLPAGPPGAAAGRDAFAGLDAFAGRRVATGERPTKARRGVGVVVTLGWLCTRNGGLRGRRSQPDHEQSEYEGDEQHQPRRSCAPCRCFGLGLELALHGCPLHRCLLLEPQACQVQGSVMDRGAPSGLTGPVRIPATDYSLSVSGQRPGATIPRTCEKCGYPPKGLARKRLVARRHGRRGQAATSPRWSVPLPTRSPRHGRACARRACPSHCGRGT